MGDTIKVVLQSQGTVSARLGQPGTPGLSAYQVAVAEGFAGTADEWLDSLQGGDGAPGPTAVSEDAGNTATLGVDGLIFVPDPEWGAITGTLADQADLKAALDGKQAAGSYATATQGALADSAVQPGDLGTAAASDAGEFATAAQGGLADSAVQPGDLGTAASEDSTAFAPASHTHTVTDIDATGTADATTYLRGDGSWATPEGGGGASDWGDIGGTLSDQTDLQDALNLKANTADLGTAASADSIDFATAAQGALADSALQSYTVSADSGNLLTLGSDSLLMLDPADLPDGGGGTAAPEVRSDTDWPYSYMGTATNGTAEGSSGWAVTRITLTSPVLDESGIGTWTGRAGLSYS